MDLHSIVGLHYNAFIHSHVDEHLSLLPGFRHFSQKLFIIVNGTPHLPIKKMTFEYTGVAFSIIHFFFKKIFVQIGETF